VAEAAATVVVVVITHNHFIICEIEI